MATALDQLRYGFLRRHGALGWIIVLNVGAFLVLALYRLLDFILVTSTFGEIVKWLALSSQPAELLYKPWTLLTYGLVHDFRGIFHLLFNMLWLYWLGMIFRQFLGDRRLYTVYTLGVLSGGVFFLLISQAPQYKGLDYTLVGASAGVTAVVVAIATLVPNYSIPLLFFGMVRLKWIALVQVALDLLFVPNGGLGNIAHLGGALMGFLFIVAQRRGMDVSQPLAALSQTFQRPGRSAQHVRVSHRSRPAQAQPQDIQGEIDRILDKIQRVGLSKLTREERKLLDTYSRQ